jgi:hypothetical protein
MYLGVPQKQESLLRDSLRASLRPIVWTGGKAFPVGLVSFGLSILTFVSSVLGVDGPIRFGSAARLSVLGGFTIDNTDYHA